MTSMQTLILSLTALATYMATVGTLVWAAIQDGRYQTAHRAA
jgi:hypothetical protein